MKVLNIVVDVDGKEMRNKDGKHIWYSEYGVYETAVMKTIKKHNCAPVKSREEYE